MPVAIEAERQDSGGMLDGIRGFFGARESSSGQDTIHWAAFQVYGHND